jgi:hypothetical protein
MLAIHPETAQQIQAYLGVSGHGHDLDALPIPTVHRSTNVQRRLLAVSQTDRILLANLFQCPKADLSARDFSSSRCSKKLYEGVKFSDLRGSPTVADRL